MSTAPKVSVIVPTYRSGRGLDRLVASLDAQSLPAEEWEVVFVDDGSPDDTWDRLVGIAKTRPNVRLERIENSGWPCRPRNVGTDLAVGEYVAYMDHDDELYPDALRDAYAFATANGADALNGKETRTNDPGWYIERYPADRAQVLGDGDEYALTPTNPHKLYRRAFLDEHGIRFREGGRVLWEDVFFNVLVSKHAAVVSTLSSTPYYHWRTTSGSGSTSFLRSNPEWWFWLEEMVASISSELDEERLSEQRRLLMEHQYRIRLIDSFNNRYAPRPVAEKKLIVERAARIQSLHFPAAFDAALNRSGRMRAHLLRLGHRHLLERLTVDDPNIPGRPRLTGAHWEDGVLVVRTETQWRDGQGRRHALKREGDRLLKDLDPRYRRVFGEDLLDVTEEIRSASVQILLRSAATKVSWPLPSESAPWIAAQGTDWGVRGSARLDPARAALGAPLQRGVWEFAARCAMPGWVQSRMARADALTPAVRVDDAGTTAVYARRDGVVVLDFDQTEQPLPRLLRPSGRPRLDGATVRIPLAGVTGDVTTTVATRLDVDESSAIGDAAAAITRMLRRITRRKGEAPTRWRSIPAVVHVNEQGAALEFQRPAAKAVRIRLADLVPGSPSSYRL